MTRTSAEAGPHECDTHDAVRMPAAKFAVAAHLLHIVALFQCGGFLLDPGGNVLSLNRIAEASLGNGLIVRGNRLMASDRASDARFKSVVELVSNVNGSAEAPATSVEIQRAGRLPLLAYLLRLDVGVRPAVNGASLLLITFDPEIRHAPATDMLTRLFDLTATEAEVAVGIGGGKRLDSIAAERGSKVDTVRVHSKKVFAKTRTRGQVELAALLARLAIVMTGDQVNHEPHGAAMKLTISSSS
jgi:DNA-binding CsgD family transcriptional regulator